MRSRAYIIGCHCVMTQERFRRIRDLFDVALTHAPNTRTAFLAQACGGDTELYEQVEKLLKAHQEGSGVIDVPEIARNMGVVPVRREGTQVGRYDILCELGHGGMGDVFLARRAGTDPSVRVAIKILRPDFAGSEVLHRFDQERRILGSLAHPNIARVLDSGATTDGLPFFVMEFVDGQRIDKYCDSLRLTISDRLSLFRQVCAAVQCAHAKGTATSNRAISLLPPADL